MADLSSHDKLVAAKEQLKEYRVFYQQDKDGELLALDIYTISSVSAQEQVIKLTKCHSVLAIDLVN